MTMYADVFHKIDTNHFGRFVTPILTTVQADSFDVNNLIQFDVQIVVFPLSSH